MQPQVPIHVDDDTGVWTTDNLPMIYVPRHFFTNNHVAVETALGRRKYEEILYPAGHKSAYFWCDKESRQHGLTGMDVFEHYLKRLSQRGWGQFQFDAHDAPHASATIHLKNSSFVLQQPDKAGKLCYMYAGWFAGAMDWVSDQNGVAARAASQETQCASEGFDHCIFTVSPI